MNVYPEKERLLDSAKDFIETVREVLPEPHVLGRLAKNWLDEYKRVRELEKR